MCLLYVLSVLLYFWVGGCLSYWALGRFQSCDGLYSIIAMVLWKNIFLNIRHHVVQVDIPRLRIDQLLNLEWKYLLPISMINLLFGNSNGVY
jgi:NADH-quinone oxidoreductase subunit H